ncbi:5-Formyltetrahydrofolate cycloligase implicated in thiamin metabolism [Pseudonocardia sp. Ae168_Ps1]|uniref:5-formyltetrahydrofolate cyclo-ligase n=1 Tax=unclassified Pseudonocardia TaxID=2619320 RepID=UPI00094B7135|nr:MULTISPECIES: 5-formyltetrahydrofolate cyclo-ligase [unclassified Pseudonocardia]OLL81588.1 5-Formyltetrahydrofolate cycloligase implicated in thiamin metabolism [Pseudonocardia sp. Ae168_Ps1]OLL84297.1 5-Formyltetrahydrofolate cycloligase implicated in thiamin metabolism [Pseudonocardia sp. Ae263_Ps1]OLL95683.1 5-Formyltetrahydrofolate cycloligase implicated in thiamin metabolism [Pseudonocardia sp. Ae356_Ps1]
MGPDQAKHAIRHKIWDLLEQHGASPGGVHGRIPDFTGAGVAADRLAMLEVWRAARTIKAVPDRPQHPARTRALVEDKLVYMAVPKLAGPRPFYLLDPAELTVPPAEAASTEVAATTAPTVGVDEMRPVDLVLCGSVAVNRRGARLGKGAGYSDIEVGLLQEAGLIGPGTTIVTTVHSLQIVDEDIPESRHDFSVDVIVTPDDVLHCSPPRRPAGIFQEELRAEQIAAIPVLASRCHVPIDGDGPP